MWETIRGYLTFTRKERLGVLFLLAVICLLFILPYFFRSKPGEPDPEAYEKMKMALQKFETVHSDSVLNSDDNNRQSVRKQGIVFPRNPNQNLNRQLFFFDPNTLKSEGWQQLGLTDHVAQTILHFIEKGGRFHKSEDLKKIYGLRSEEYERLLPYLRIAEVPQSARSPFGYDKKNGNASLLRFSKKLENTDVNQADSVQWSRLPGIGLTLASRIVHFRERLGDFTRLIRLEKLLVYRIPLFKKSNPFCS